MVWAPLPVAGSAPPPKPIALMKSPVMAMAFELPTAIATPFELSALPKPLVQIQCPSVPPYLPTKESEPPALVSGPPPKSAGPLNEPVTTTLLAESTARPLPAPAVVGAYWVSLPKAWDETWARFAPEYLARKACGYELALGTDPPPKSTTPKNCPVMKTSPALSRASASPSSEPVPPMRLDQSRRPSAPA